MTVRIVRVCLHRRLAAFACLLAVASLAAHAAQTGERDVEWKVPPKAASKANPLANRPDVVAGGQKLFRERCATCHGEDGRGSAKGPDLTEAGVQAQTDGAIFWKISSGNSRRGMPTFSILPELQRWQLVLHLRALALVH
jgi:mono/diheme cytochrome c family protein